MLSGATLATTIPCPTRVCALAGFLGALYTDPAISTWPEECMPDKSDQRPGTGWLQSLPDDEFRELRRAIREEADRRGLTQRERAEGGGGKVRKDHTRKG